MLSAALISAVLSSTPSEAATRARFRWRAEDAWRVDVVVQHETHLSGQPPTGLKLLGTYDLTVDAAPGAWTIRASAPQVLDGDALRPASPVEALAIGAWADYHVDRKGRFVGLASGDARAGVGTDALAEGARRQWSDLAGAWIGRWEAGTHAVDLAVPYGDVQSAQDQVEEGVPCGLGGAPTCVRVVRAVTIAPSPEARTALGAEGQLLGWTDETDVVFDPAGLRPVSQSTTRTVRFALELPGHAPIEATKVDQTVRRFTPATSNAN